MRAITQERFKYLLQFIATQGPRPLKGNMRTTCSSILPYEAPNYKSANGPRKAVGTQVERLSSRQQKSTLTMKRVSPHERKRRRGDVGRSEGNYRRLLIKPSKEKMGRPIARSGETRQCAGNDQKKAGTGSCRRLLVA